MPAAQEERINLLAPSEFEMSFWGKFLRWAVTTGRYVIIVTELIVIVAFLSRFKLDTQVAGLKDDIQGKKNVLDAQATVETQFVQVQKKLAAAGTLLNSTLNAGDEIAAVDRTVPPGLRFTDFSISKDRDTIGADVVDSGSLGLMLGQMSRSGRWKTVEVTGLAADAIKGITLSLTLTR